jgi:hypothetical protein
MPLLVANGAELRCDHGTAPCRLVVTPRGHASDQQQVAHVDDHAPVLNIASFGLCTSMANPAVASATAASFGVMTPQPCMPVTTRPWEGGSQFLVENVGKREVPALMSTSTCACDWFGRISVISPGTSIIIDG